MERVEGRSRTGHVIGVVALLALGLLAALACLGGIINAASSAAQRTKAGETLGGAIALAVISAVVLVLCIAGAVHLEHQLRRHRPVAQAWMGPARRSRRRYSPAVMVFEALLFAGMTIGFAVGTVVTHANANRSNRVQHHGALRAAEVVSVRNVWHSSRGGGYYTADVAADFQPPLDGRTATVVHYPGHVGASQGSVYRVLVDPSNPAYAEFPGAPATRSSAWIVMLVFTVLFAVVDVFLGRLAYRLLRHRRMASLPAIT